MREDVRSRPGAQSNSNNELLKIDQVASLLKVSVGCIRA